MEYSLTCLFSTALAASMVKSPAEESCSFCAANNAEPITLMSLLETTVRSALETRVEPVTFSMLLLLLVLEVVDIENRTFTRALCGSIGAGGIFNINIACFGADECTGLAFNGTAVNVDAVFCTQDYV